MGWLYKKAETDRERIKDNIKRLEDLSKRVHDLSFFVVASQSGGYEVLKAILDENIVKGHPLIKNKLSEALIGENNQKIALDAPLRFQQIIHDAEKIIKIETSKERTKLSELDSELENE
jgi:hypothetical protein